jgi:DNA-binding transcriptional MerR regulator
MAKQSIKEFRSHPPFTADVLILRANELLAARGAQIISKRTLRFYTGQDVVPKPLGSPKFARYAYEHLLSLVAARALQDQGQKLQQIKQEVSEVARGRLDRLESLVDKWMDNGVSVSGRFAQIKEGTADFAGDTEMDAIKTITKLGTSNLRVRLSGAVSLEISDTASIKAELGKAHKELGRILNQLD